MHVPVIERIQSPAVAAACLLLLLLLPGSTLAQEPVDLPMIERIRGEGLERSQAMAAFAHLTTVIGPRLSGSPAYDAAAIWTRDWLRSRGVANPRLEAFDFGAGWTQRGQTLEMTTPRFMPLIGYAEAWTPPTPGIVEGTAVYIGDLDAAAIEALGDRLRGAIVLANAPQAVFTRADRPQPTDAAGPVRTGAPARAPGELGVSPLPTGQLNQLLQRLGAAAVLRPGRGEHGTVFVLGNRNTPRDAVPSLVLAAEHYNLLVRLVESGEPVRLRVSVDAEFHDDNAASHNVLAEIPGIDPLLGHEVVLLGAHLDSWHAGAGAADNADGVAVAMEAMRILAAIGAQPRRTIRIALWGGEEQGLLGSRAYVERHLDGEANRAAHEALSVYLNDDPGSGPTYGWYMEGNTAAKAIFDAWLEPLRDLGVRRNVIEGIPSTDHLTFTRVGIPGFTAIKDYVDYDVRMHHTNADTPERILEEDLKQAAVVLAVFAWHAAMRDERIPRLPVGTTPAPADTPVALLRRSAAPADTLVALARRELQTGTAAGRETARSLFRAAIQVNPADLHGYVGISNSYFRGARISELPPEWTASAIAFAQKAVSLEPQSADAHFALATAYFRQFWFGLAIDHLLHAWELEPRPSFAYWLGWMYSEVGELEQMLPWLERARAMEPEMSGLTAEFGYANRVIGRHDEAERWLRLALGDDADDLYAHANLMLLLLMQGRDDEALAHATALATRDDATPAMLGHSGFTFWFAGHAHRARELLEAAAAADPGMWIGTWGTIVTQPLGEILWRDGNTAAARQAFATAVSGYRERFDRASEGWGYRYDLAGIAAVQGQYDEAFGWLEDAIAFGWTDYALARRDPALAALHSQQRFQTLMAAVEARVARANRDAAPTGDR